MAVSGQSDLIEEVQVSGPLQYVVRDGRPLSGILYRPAVPRAVPVLVGVHGGGWKHGTPERYAGWGQWLASRGIAVFAIEYRLATASARSFPDAALDVGAAVRFISESAIELGLNREAVFLMGDSAGAHLTSLAALAGGAAIFARQEDSALAESLRIRGVIAVYGVYDLLCQWEHDQLARPKDQITEALMGFSPLANRLGYLEASPLMHVTTRAPRTSFLVAWGTEDDVVDWPSQSGRFVTALKQTGQYVRTVPVVGAPHFWIDQPIDEIASFSGFLAPKICKFVRDHSTGKER
jgi:acetyl esterase/lipase